MRFLTLEDCSDGELHCLYHDPERTVTVLHPRTACSLQVYAPEEGHHATIGAFHTRRPNNAHAWWLQLLGIADNQLLGIPLELAHEAATAVHDKQPPQLKINRNVISWHLMDVRSVIPDHEVLDEEEHIQTIQPLPSPWSWPSNTFYREARCGYIEYLTEPLIAELITHGLLLANETGIRWKHLDQYILVQTEEPVFNRANRPRFEKLHAHAFRYARIGRPGLNGEPNGIEERSGTPIVELNSPPLGMGEKKVRLCSKRTCVCIDGDEAVVKEEDVEDNEGKTAGKAREVDAGRRRKVRSKICWDSDRGF